MTFVHCHHVNYVIFGIYDVIDIYGIGHNIWMNLSIWVSNEGRRIGTFPYENTNLAAQGALAHRLHRRPMPIYDNANLEACHVQGAIQVGQKVQSGAKRGSFPAYWALQTTFNEDTFFRKF